LGCTDVVGKLNHGDVVERWTGAVMVVGELLGVKFGKLGWVILFVALTLAGRWRG
jgi:hypothetical protein